MAEKRKIKVICIMVAAVNGKTTNGNNPNIYHWSSKEDSDLFFSTINKYNLLIMGRKTYENAKHLMHHQVGRLRIIMTKNPQLFSNELIPGQLEFSDENPSKLLERLEKQGITTALLLGGAEVNTAFLKENLLDELWLTIEPKLFGTGNPLFGQENFEKDLHLISVEKLNETGTLLLKYSL